MKLITFASFKGGAGKTTAVMAVTSTLAKMGKRVALIDADENLPLLDWRDTSAKSGTWSDNVVAFEADDLSSFEKAYDTATDDGYDFGIIDTRGGGSELNNACVINTHLIVVPSALTTLDMTQALTTFEHVIGVHQQMEMEIPTLLLVQRVPVGKLTTSQKNDLEALSELPCCNTRMHSRDAFASIGKRGLLHLALQQISDDPRKRISANHIATAISEAQAVTDELLAVLDSETGAA